MNQAGDKPNFSSIPRMQVKLFAELQYKSSADSQEALHRQDLHRVKNLSKDGIKHYSAKRERFVLPFVNRLQLQPPDLPVNHPFMQWIVKRASWLLNRFLIHDDVLSSYQRRFKQPSMIGIAEFGETVNFKAH